MLAQDLAVTELAVIAGRPRGEIPDGSERPLRLRGGIGLPAFLLGVTGLSYFVVSWVLARFGVHGFGPIGSRPLLIYSLACRIIGFQMLAIGILSEPVTAQTIRNEHKYSIAELTQPTHQDVGAQALCIQRIDRAVLAPTSLDHGLPILAIHAQEMR